jgi:hypothetical protein
MKRLAISSLLVVISAALFAQAIQYEVKVKYNHAASGITADITMTIKHGEPPYTFFLMTNDPVTGQVLMQSQAISRKSFTFRDVKPGKYFLKVVDQAGLPAGKTVEVSENEIGKN